jgi:hypothetical protein
VVSHISRKTSEMWGTHGFVAEFKLNRKNPAPVSAWILHYQNGCSAIDWGGAAVVLGQEGSFCGVGEIYPPDI